MSVLLLKDEEILKRLGFIKTQMFTGWFDLEVAEKFILLKKVALMKGLFDEPTRTTVNRSSKLVDDIIQSADPEVLKRNVAAWPPVVADGYFQ